MTTTRKIAWAAALAAVLATSGCFLDSDDDGPAADAGPPASGEPVPESAAASSEAFTAFVQSLRIDDETSEPNTLSTTFAVPDDDTSEPKTLGS